MEPPSSDAKPLRSQETGQVRAPYGLLVAADELRYFERGHQAVPVVRSPGGTPFAGGCVVSAVCLDEVEEARRIFSRFPLTAPVPTGASSRDLFGKAHWLAASFAAKVAKPDCRTVNNEIAAAEAIAPYLTADIANDKPLDVCREPKG